MLSDETPFAVFGGFFVRRLPARRSLAAISALAVTVSIAGSVVAAVPASAAFAGGPTAGDPFALTSTVTSGDPVLAWRDLVTGATGTYSHAGGNPAISPDGTKAAVLTEDGSTDASDVSIINLTTDTVTEVAKPTSTDTQTLLDPAWSTDGNTVYFTVESALDTDTPTDTISSVPASTIPPSTGTQVLPSGVNGAYATAYASTSSSTVITYVDETTGSSCAIAQIASAGATPTCLLQESALPSTIVSALTPRWSPDNSTLALGYETADGTGVLVVPVTGTTAGTPRVLTASNANGTDDAPYSLSDLSWTADGSQIIYGLGRFDADDAPIGSGTVGSIDVATGTHVAAIAALGNVGVDTHFPATTTPAGSEFIPVTPTRIADTRSGLGGQSGALGANGAFDLQVTGPLVPSNATAVVLNVTAALPTATGNIEVYPTPSSGSAAPLVSNLNLAAGRNSANAVVVSLPTSGKIRIKNAAGNTQVIVDVAGYYVPTGTANALPYSPLTPTRVLDTRTGMGIATGALGAGKSADLKVAGVAGVPANASAVVLNLTGLPGASKTFITAYPAGAASILNVSNLNLTPGETRANLITVPVGNDGDISLFNDAGTAGLVADVAGYYGAGAANEYVPLSPLRILDTRSTTYSTTGNSKLGAARTLALQVTGTLTTSNGEVQVPSTATAAVFNLTGANATGNTYLAAYPSTGTTPPTTSNVNILAGTTVPNLAVVQLPPTGGAITIYNNVGTTNVLADLAGYFRPASS